MRAAFVINGRQKERYIYKAVQGALAQVHPCDVIVSIQDSTDGTLAEAERAVKECTRNAEHTVRIVHCPVKGPYSMGAMNAHFSWASKQVADDAEWIFQSSADDYSLPARVSVCMEAVAKNPCSAVATTMYFEEPDKPNREIVSGYPRETGYVKAGDGLLNLAYGSTIAGYHRSFLEKVAHRAGKVTPDVFFGVAASLAGGFYCIVNPQHVHSNIADPKNTGFQGKMRAASGDESLKLAALNHEQLLNLYFACWEIAQELCQKGIPADDLNALVNMVIGQAKGMTDAREVLRARDIPQCVLELP